MNNRICAQLEAVPALLFPGPHEWTSINLRKKSRPADRAGPDSEQTKTLEFAALRL